MLRNIDLDEISDGKLYTAGDLAKVGCQDCEGCCDCCCQMRDTIIRPAGRLAADAGTRQKL